MLIGIRGKNYKWQRIQLPIRDYLRKTKTKPNKNKKTPNLPIGDSPSLQKYANNLDINEAQACGSLSGHESTAKILCMEFMPGLLPLPLGKKGKDKGERERDLPQEEVGETLEPPGAKNELACAQLVEDLNSKWVPDAGHPLGACKVEVRREAVLLHFPSQGLRTKVGAKT